MNDKFLKPYNPQETEGAIYKKWEESGLFNPDECIAQGYTQPDAEPFSIVLPPPNVTGTLHIGHASMLVIEDIMVRFERMRGKRTLWVPGTDHAAIATQSKVEGIIYKEEKKRRHDLGREELLKRVNAFAAESHDTIVNQVRKMGASVDWSREAFTLDAKREKAVNTAFKQMYEDGIIYRGNRIINWDPKGQTTISDDEIVYVEEKGKFYYFKYGPFIIGTARPETKFGDKYVVMHPDDKRYADYTHGQKIELEWINGPISATVIKDESIDMAFGTGVMTITPAHSVVDFDIAQRHKLDSEQIIDKVGKLLPIAGEFAGQKITDARSKIVDKLREKGLIASKEELVKLGVDAEGEADYVHNISTAERTGGVIEPQIMNQWFIDVNKKFILKESKINGVASGSEVSLKELMIAAVEGGQTHILPDRFEKVYFSWINNLRDWCISRQIWYGHRIPVWYKKDAEGNETETYCGFKAPAGSDWVQDEDTLDTWFSSGLWTFSTLGWPDKEEFAKHRMYHPTSVLETGYDIIFFWVARMVLMSTYFLGEVPFKTVYLHGLVRDAQGRKMSKSLGNIIDPLTVSEKYGTDAVRLSLIIGTGPGNDLKMSEDKIRGYKNFANKIWNATRFVLTSVEGANLTTKPALTATDEAYVKELDEVIADVTKEMENFHFYLAGEKLYHYFWHTFADKIIEETKGRIGGGKPSETPVEIDPVSKLSAQWTIYHILTTVIKALHPFMPFVTEEIWSAMPGVGSEEKGGKLLMVEKWPKV